MRNFVLFPFDKVKKGSNIIIYAAGDVGKLYLKQIEATNYCNIICFVDADADNIKMVGEYNCITIDKLQAESADYFLIAKRVKSSIASIYQSLIDYKIEKEKIICIESKYIIDYYEDKKIIPENANWKAYYTEAEKDAASQYAAYLHPLFQTYLPDSLESSAMDFACGEGRMTNLARESFKKITCCDIEGNALEYCKKRFINDGNILFAASLADGIAEKAGSYQAIYSWDAMVHFAYDSVDFYLGEFYRLLQKGGIAIIRHSNLKNSSCKDIKEEWTENPGWRSNFSKEDMLKLALKREFEVLEQKVINWELEDMDCITILRK